MKEIEILKSVLASNFHYSFYEDAILNIRSEINDIPHYRENWHDVIKFVLCRQFTEGEPLKIVQDDANLVLYDNTDEEAYRWLDLFLINVINSKEVISYETKKII